MESIYRTLDWMLKLINFCRNRNRKRRNWSLRPYADCFTASRCCWSTFRRWGLFRGCCAPCLRHRRPRPLPDCSASCGLYRTVALVWTLCRGSSASSPSLQPSGIIRSTCTSGWNTWSVSSIHPTGRKSSSSSRSAATWWHSCSGCWKKDLIRTWRRPEEPWPCPYWKRWAPAAFTAAGLRRC